MSPPREHPPAKKGAPQTWLRSALERLDPTDTECCEWPFAATRAGYGVLHWNGALRYAHQLACEHLHGPRPAGLEVAHTCGNPRCLNHVRWATHAANVADMVLHGTAVRGEHHPCAKVTRFEVQRIRRRAAEGVMQKELALDYGLSPSHVARITAQRSWAWLPLKRIIPRQAAL